jgi:hypothetical protein
MQIITGATLLNTTSGSRQVILGKVLYGTTVPVVSVSVSGVQGIGKSGNVQGSGARSLTGTSATGKVGGIESITVIAKISGTRAFGRVGSVVPPPVMYLEPWATVPGYRSKTIPSYLYIQYDDDDDLQAFVASYNRMAQEYVSWFAEVNLPVYTGLTGQLLDWVAAGLYGQNRPLLPSGRNSNLGPLNTFAFNVLPFNGRKKIEPTNFYATTDDVFKRIITWNFFKGDGRTFSVRWLKRRIMRFLAGENGVNFNVDNTYQISVSFGIHPQVNIRILNGVRNLLGGAIPNRCAFNTKRLNQLDTEFVSFAPLTYAPILQAAINSGAVQLPFQYDWVVTIEGGS